MPSVAELEVPTLSPMEQLLLLLKQIPQVNDAGQIEYLITNGIAVELLTEKKRQHDDLDAVALRNQQKLTEFGIDVVTPQEYFAGMNLSNDFLEQTAQRVSLPGGASVLIVHPAIIMVQKATRYTYGGKDFPRVPKDLEEVKTILEYWYDREPIRRSWIPVVKGALASLPPDRIAGTADTLEHTLARIGNERRARRRRFFHTAPR